MYEAARASAKREAEDFAKGGEAAKVYHPHKQFVKSWFVVEHGSLICSVSHNPLFFLTPLLSCPLLGFLRDVSSFSKPQTVNCVRNAPLLTISCSARKLMQYSIVVRRRRLGKIHFTAICLVLDANFTKRKTDMAAEQKFQIFTV